jgi:hypothetical protein
MLSFPGSLKVFVAVEPCDMRKGFNGLHAMASKRLGEDPRQGALFVLITSWPIPPTVTPALRQPWQAGPLTSAALQTI